MKKLSGSALKYWLPVIAYAALIFYISSIPFFYLPGLAGTSYEQIDPDRFALHFIEYAVFGVLLFRALSNTHAHGMAERALALTLVLGFAYGLTDEMHQYFVPFREPSVFDILANGLGSMMGGLARSQLSS